MQVAIVRVRARRDGDRDHQAGLSGGPGARDVRLDPRRHRRIGHRHDRAALRDRARAPSWARGCRSSAPTSRSPSSACATSRSRRPRTCSGWSTRARTCSRCSSRRRSRRVPRGVDEVETFARQGDAADAILDVAEEQRCRPDRGRQPGDDGRQAVPARLGAEQGLPPRALLGADRPDDVTGPLDWRRRLGRAARGRRAGVEQAVAVVGVRL